MTCINEDKIWLVTRMAIKNLLQKVV